MRKLICLVTLAMLILPVMASAQINCCQLKASVKYDGVSYSGTISEAVLAAGACGTGSAATPNECTAAASTNCWTGNWGMICMLNSVNKIFSIVFVILMAIVGIMVIIGAFNIVTAGGSPDKVTAGRNYILYAVIGLVVALFARAIPAIVMMIV